MRSLISAIGSQSATSYLPDFLPVIYARLSPSAASLSAASSFAAVSTPASASLSPSMVSAATSSAIASIQSGIAIPASASAAAGAPSLSSSSIGGGGGGASGAHIEPSEELRLNLLQLLVKLIECEKSKYLALLRGGDGAAASASLQTVYGNLDKLVAVVLKTVNDPFPDLKKESCYLVTLLSEVLGLNATSEGGAAGLTVQARTDAANALQKSLLPNLKHQHSQVRIQALQAFGSVLKANSGAESLSSGSVDALPLLSTLLYDRTPKVREVFLGELGGWLMGLPKLLPMFQARLLALLINLTADEVPAIASRAVQTINEVAAAVHKRKHEQENMNTEQAQKNSGDAAPVSTNVAMEDVAASTGSSNSGGSPWLSSPLCLPFSSRPPASARVFVAGHMGELLPGILGELSDWTHTKRLRASGALKSLLVLLEDAVLPSLLPVLQALTKSVRDEDSAVHALLAECAQVLGCFLRDATTWMEYTLSELQRNADNNYRTSLLVVLYNLVKGMPIMMQTSSSGGNGGSTPATVSAADAAAQAANDAKIAHVFPHLLNTLSHADLCCSDDLAIRLQLHRILSCVLSRIPKSCGGNRAFADKIFHMIVQLDTKSGTAATGTAASSASGATTSNEEEKHVLTALELLARCEQQYGDLKVDLSVAAAASSSSASSSSAVAAASSPAASTAASAALLQAVYCRHFAGELVVLLGSELLAAPEQAPQTLPLSWGQPSSSGTGAGPTKDAPQVHFVAMTFFQLLDRAAGISTLGATATTTTTADAASSSSAAASSSSSSSASSPAISLLESHLPTLMPVLVHSARASNDSAMRSLVLNFLYKLSLLHGGSILRGSDPHMLAVVVADILVPNCVWKSGRVAASLRLHALTVLHALFAQGLITPSLGLQLGPKVLPILQSNLDDDDAKLRMLVLLLLQQLLTLLPAHSVRLEDDALTELHRDLLKRLDDSHDPIRLQVVSAFSLLFHRVFPAAEDYDKTDSYFRYILSCFFIYLDDANPEIIDACFAFLQSAIPYNRKVFIQETETAKKKQTTGRYCDQLMHMAQQQ